MKQDNRTLEELEETYLSDKSVAEFDRLVRKSGLRRRRQITWGALMVAAVSLALILTLNFRGGRCEFNGIEIADGIQQIMSLNTDEVKSITATPKGNMVILTALMIDGSECSYVMSRDPGTADVISITAMK
ncbi:MAG TPA: hypothetical protein DHU72_06155 [Rikenellaceae bacterium]|nr:hypothetical protein [Rikenellaceae bacterium]